MNKINPISIFLLLIVAACNVGERKIMVDNSFEITVPSSFENVSGLNQSALLELSDKKDSSYFIIIQEKKNEILSSGLTFDLRTYTKFASRNATVNVKYLQLNETEEINIGTYKATATSATGLMEQQKIFYYVIVLETKDSFFQFISWMPEGKETKNLEKVMEIVNSFKAL